MLAGPPPLGEFPPVRRLDLGQDRRPRRLRHRIAPDALDQRPVLMLMVVGHAGIVTEATASVATYLWRLCPKTETRHAAGFC